MSVDNLFTLRYEDCVELSIHTEVILSALFINAECLLLKIIICNINTLLDSAWN